MATVALFGLTKIQELTAQQRKKIFDQLLAALICNAGIIAEIAIILVS